MSGIVKYKTPISEKIKRIPKEYFYLVAILVVSFLVKYDFVFYHTDYSEYLYSDMEGYWNRANHRYDGYVRSVAQTAAWAPFYHYFLTWIFKATSFLNLYEKRHEIVLLINIVFSTISVVFVYLIAKKLIKKTSYLIIGTVLYAFSYPFIYINAFVLSEHLAIPMLILATFLVFYYPNKKMRLFLAGIVFGIAVATRPALGLIGISYAVFLYFVNGKDLKSVLKAMIFSMGFFLVFSLVAIENYYSSEGKLKGLSAHGGVNFYMAQCKVGKVVAHFDEYTFVLEPPIFIAEKELRRKDKFETDYPFYKQKYYYKMGFECLRNNLLGNFVTNCKLLKGLFFGPFFPPRADIPTFRTVMPIFNLMHFMMTISLGLFFYLIRGKEVDIPKVLFLFSIFAWIFLTTNFFIIGQRQMLPTYFAIYILFFTLLPHLKHYSYKALKYFIALLVLYMLFALLL